MDGDADAGIYNVEGEKWDLGLRGERTISEVQPSEWVGRSAEKSA